MLGRRTRDWRDLFTQSVLPGRRTGAIRVIRKVKAMPGRHVPNFGVLMDLAGIISV